MQSAKVIPYVIDRSFQIPQRDSRRIALVVESDYGMPGVIHDISGTTHLRRIFGSPSPSNKTLNSAFFLASHVNKIALVRAIGRNYLYASALLSFDTSFGNKAVSPHIGLSLQDLASFSFPTEVQDRTYLSTTVTAIRPLSSDKLSFEVSSPLSSGSLVTLSATDDAPTFKIVSSQTSNIKRDVIVLDSGVDVSYAQKLNTLITDKDIPDDVIILSDGSNLTSFIVSSHDLVHEGDTLTDGQVVTKKKKSTLPLHSITFDVPNKVIGYDSTLHIIDTYDVAQVYSVLLYASAPGTLANSFNVYTAPAPGFPVDDEVYRLVISYDGIDESFYVSNLQGVSDSSGESLFIEDVLSTRSKLVRALVNTSAPTKPVPSNRALWVRNPDPVYRVIGTLSESVFKGDSELAIDDPNGTLSIGSKILIRKSISLSVGGDFIMNVSDPLGVSLEYTIVSIENGHYFLNRPLTKLEEASVGDEVLFLDESFSDSSRNIVNGFVQYSAVTLPEPIVGLSQFYNFKVGKYFGTVTDAGANPLAGGSNGSALTAGDFVAALDVVKANASNLDLPYITDGGYTNSDYLNAIAALKPHGYLSLDLRTEKYGELVDIINWKKSLGIDSSKASLFAGWERIYSGDSKSLVDIPFSTIAVMLQAIASGNGELRAIAGLKRGTFNGRNLSRTYSEAERDTLVENQINPFIITDGGGFAIWGDETLLSTPSPLQMRSVVLLLDDIVYRLNKALKKELFDYNNSDSWEKAETIISSVLRDDYKSKGALFDFIVAVSDIITDTDIDNRRMPIFVGVQPTPSINTIPLGLNVFNKSLKITY